MCPMLYAIAMGQIIKPVRRQHKVEQYINRKLYPVIPLKQARLNYIMCGYH